MTVMMGGSDSLLSEESVSESSPGCTSVWSSAASIFILIIRQTLSSKNARHLNLELSRVVKVELSSGLMILRYTERLTKDDLLAAAKASIHLEAAMQLRTWHILCISTCSGVTLIL